MEEKRIFKIPDYNYSYLQERIAKLNKKANKLNCQSIKLNIVEEMDEETDKDNGIITHFYCITIDGESPVINGWKFIATIERICSEDGKQEETLVSVVPNEVLPAQYRNVTQMACEHCGHNRYRKQVFVVQHEDGQYKQVGRSCLKDFLGHTSPEAYADWAEWLCSLDELCSDSEHNMFGRPEEKVRLERFLTVVHACIRNFGWISRAKAREEFYKTSTASDAWTQIFSKELKEKDKITLEEIDAEVAKETIEWMEELFHQDNDNLTDYMYTLKILAKLGTVQWKTSGVGASAIIAMQKAKDRLKQTESRRKISNFFGTVGKRAEYTLTVEKVSYSESQYGVTSIYRMLDSEGNIAMWFSSKDCLEVGKTYQLKGTVKKHEEWNGFKQTHLTRCAIIKEIEVEQTA